VSRVITYNPSLCIGFPVINWNRN